MTYSEQFLFPKKNVVSHDYFDCVYWRNEKWRFSFNLCLFLKLKVILSPDYSSYEEEKSSFNFNSNSILYKSAKE